jgi:hypothetical protein
MFCFIYYELDFVTIYDRSIWKIIYDWIIFICLCKQIMCIVEKNQNTFWKSIGTNGAASIKISPYLYNMSELWYS